MRTALARFASPVLWVVLLAAPAWGQGAREAFAPPAVTAEPSPLDIGDIRPGDRITRVVTLTNTTDREITLLRARTSCACAVPGFDEPVVLEPGQAFEMPITYTGFDEHFGEVGQQVVVFAEGFSIPIQIPVMANVNLGIRPVIEYAPPGQYRTGRITLTAIDGNPFRIESVNFAPPEYLDGFNPEADAPRAEYIIGQDFSGLEPESIPPYLLIVTDAPGSPVMNLRVFNLDHEPPRFRRPFLIQDSPVLLHALPAAGISEAWLTLRAVRGEPETLLEWFEAGSQHASVTLLGVRTEPENALAFLRIGIRPYPSHHGLITINVWATIDGHTEHAILHARVFPAEQLEQP